MRSFRMGAMSSFGIQYIDTPLRICSDSGTVLAEELRLRFFIVTDGDWSPFSSGRDSWRGRGKGTVALRCKKAGGRGPGTAGVSLTTGESEVGSMAVVFTAAAESRASGVASMMMADL